MIKTLCSKDFTSNLNNILNKNNSNYNSCIFSQKLAFILFSSLSFKPKARTKFSASWWSSNHFGCKPVNWLNQTRRNLTNEYLNLNFVTISKSTLLHSFIAEKFFISCFWLIPVSLARTTFKLYRYRYFAAYSFGLKVFN